MTGVWCVRDFPKFSGESHVTKLENTTLSPMVTSRAPLLSLGHSRPDRWSFCCFSEFYFFHHKSWLPRGRISMCLKSLERYFTDEWPKNEYWKEWQKVALFPFCPSTSWPMWEEMAAEFNQTPHLFFFFSLSHILASKDIKSFITFLRVILQLHHLRIFSWSFRHTASYREMFSLAPILSFSASPGVLAFVSWCFFSPCVLSEGFGEQMHCYHN